jgi:hypothetical protein
VDCIDEDSDFSIEPGQLELAKDKARAHAKSQHQIKLARQERATAAAEAVTGR